MRRVILESARFATDFSFSFRFTKSKTQILICIFLLLMWCTSTEELTIRTKNGPVRAIEMFAGTHTVYGFRNIPFAEQPEGSLRFELPREPKPWLSEDDLYTDIIPLCPQPSFWFGRLYSVAGQENCLYLNVYVRKDHESENSSLPVLVYFHGGGFHQGNNDEHVADFLLRFNDIILVTPNYRLGILGFLSFRDSVLPGNLGLWDQHAALKWVSENINIFGGDRHRITIAGHEAGGASVGFHILAPTSHDYFQAAISSTGTAFSPHLLDEDPFPTLAETVMKSLNCSSASTAEILLCLKNATIMDIIKIQIKSAPFLPTLDRAAYSPFIPYSPKSLYQEGYQKNVNYLVGVTENEASIEVARDFQNVLAYHHLDKMIAHYLQPYIRNVSHFDEVVKAAKYHYLRGIEIPAFESIEPHLIRMMDDFLYRSPAEQVLRLHSQKTENTFMYTFKYATDNACGREERKCFGDEYCIFNSSPNTIQYKPNQFMAGIERVVETASEVWGNFVKTGQPDVQQRWKSFGDDRQINYAVISEVLQPEVSLDQDNTEFWSTLVADIKAAQNVSEDWTWTPHPNSESLAAGTWGAAGLAILCGVLCIAIIGLVVITKTRTLTVSNQPVSISKDVKYSKGIGTSRHEK